ncbi:bifunctional helix-turn-helix transcriptional regulator/GNAT family N-acetyltransferase [Marinomonas mediterranea]|uniref:GCN5-related N-acetyltransferase n=1 Tax=Marinomonas mediterranea (strain ATCC 700492 / JCM 21426 / NBRC 103028 / MMB-1) TaxID=717774 RepID=F2JTI8_MARM1|nr:bifunctional helix-turn-helix transcriptional regulator/GNAT family N-acetyltransferase [Marinomonas mediterranea]ADZ91502.1 GCN5-related N-acetyltransferase [Marinomonas mediterranea MMB-1]WCN17610.1 GNAT family N-acetyltransferase [Marinomonas mediterranea MMB-1]
MEQFGILSFGSRLKRLSDFLYGEVQAVYLASDTPISSTYFPILRLLSFEGALGVVEISEKLGISHPAVSKQVNKMVRDALLVKKADSLDQRKTLLALSDSASQSMVRAKPVLEAIDLELTRLIESFSLSSTFLASFTKVEQEVLSLGLAKQVVTQCKFQNKLELKPLSEVRVDSFRELNMSWLNQYFSGQITEEDRCVLETPIESIVEKGGEVWAAVVPEESASNEEGDNKESGYKVVGVFALRPSKLGLQAKSGANEMELIKMAVTETEQGKGLGHYLLLHALRRTRALGSDKLVLETANKLVAAMKLYQGFGFVEKNVDHFSVERADVFMELEINTGASCE